VALPIALANDEEEALAHLLEDLLLMAEAELARVEGRLRSAQSRLLVCVGRLKGGTTAAGAADGNAATPSRSPLLPHALVVRSAYMLATARAMRMAAHTFLHGRPGCCEGQWSLDAMLALAQVYLDLAVERGAEHYFNTAIEWSDKLHAPAHTWRARRAQCEHLLLLRRTALAATAINALVRRALSTLCTTQERKFNAL